MSERIEPIAEANYIITYMLRVAYEPETVERFVREVIPEFA